MSDPVKPQNGNSNAVNHKPECFIRLDYDPATGAMKISGSIPSIEVARHMLAQAGWEYEAQWRQNRAAAFAQELAENRKLAHLSETILGKRN